MVAFSHFLSSITRQVTNLPTVKDAMTSIRTIVLLLAVIIAPPAFAQAPAAAAKPADNMQMLRDKLSGDKKLVVTENLDLTEAQAKAFWPLYESYQAELHKINDRLALLIVGYAKQYSAKTLTDASALKLLNEYMALDEAEVKLKHTYVQKFGAVLPGLKLVHYLQIENKIRAIQKFEFAREVPLVP